MIPRGRQAGPSTCPTSTRAGKQNSRDLALHRYLFRYSVRQDADKIDRRLSHPAVAAAPITIESTEDSDKYVILDGSKKEPDEV